MQNLEIQINKDIISKIKSLNFNVDQLGSILLVLFGLYENRVDILDEFDDYNRQRRALYLYKEIEARKLIVKNEKEDQPHYLLTKDGTRLVEYMKNQFIKIQGNVTSEEISLYGVGVPKETKHRSVEWIEEWLDLFPRGVKSMGKLVRSDKASCDRKMANFMQEYPKYSNELIMRATKMYLDERRKADWQYTRCAVYFIYRVDDNKQEKSSDLAAWCEEALNSKDIGGNQFDLMV